MARIHHRLLLILTGFLLLWATGAAHAQSFDCARARTADERLICDIPLLGELDEIMALLYTRLRRYTQQYDNAMGLQAQLKDEARAFLRQRSACGANAACIEQAYRNRIRQLLDHWKTAMEGSILSGSPAADEEEGMPPPTPAALMCRALKLHTTARYRSLCPAPLEYDDMVEGWPLGGGLVACALPCSMGAYNVSYVVWLVNARARRVLRPVSFPVWQRGRLRQLEEVMSPVYDPARRELRAFLRGRGLGDCGEKWRWRWNGRQFTLVEQLAKDNCDGRESGWRRTYPR